MNQDEVQPFACDLTAIPEESREQHLAAIPKIFQAAQEVHELPNGYAFQFRNEPGRFQSLANFIEYEQLCCPFEGFTVKIEPYGGPIWLHLTGGEGYKDMMKAGLKDMFSAADNIQRTSADEDALKAMIDTLAPTMRTLMEKSG